MKKTIFNLMLLGSVFLLSVAADCRYNTGTSDDWEWDINRYRRERKAKLNFPRPVIYNNDGDDVYIYYRKYPDSGQFSLDRFLSLRTSAVPETGISTISYCTSRGFGSVLHRSKVAEMIGSNPDDHFPYKDEKQKLKSKFYIPSALPEFLVRNTDPLKVMSEFAKKHKLEFFWSNRMNDTHDVSHTTDAPHFLWSRYKEMRPEYLFGKMGEKLPHGRWSSVDFSVPEVRQLCVDMFTEVCVNYDVDGIELDFCRHLELFKEVAYGGKATSEQLNMLTHMVKTIREMTERVGMKKKEPILVSVRVPDSFEYCRDIGIDLDSWMKQGLIDMVIGSDYFRLNTWDYLVESGNKYGVKVYAGLSEPRVKKEHPLLKRRQTPVFRARASAAWKAGVWGLYLFNQFNPHQPYFAEIDEPAKLKLKNKLYFVTNRNGIPDKYLKGGSQYARLPLLTPQNVLTLRNGETVDLPIEIGEEGDAPDIYLVLYSERNNLALLEISLNKKQVALEKVAEGLSIYPIPEKVIKDGINTLTLHYPDSGNKDSVNKGEAILQDAALLVVHDHEDPFTRELARLCRSDNR